LIFIDSLHFLGFIPWIRWSISSAPHRWCGTDRAGKISRRGLIESWTCKGRACWLPVDRISSCAIWSSDWHKVQASLPFTDLQLRRITNMASTRSGFNACRRSRNINLKCENSRSTAASLQGRRPSLAATSHNWK
jgi:hypothetical protein